MSAGPPNTEPIAPPPPLPGVRKHPGKSRVTTVTGAVAVLLTLALVVVVSC